MSNYDFRKYQPASLRVWHWLNAFTILGLLSTVLLRKTFLSWRTNAALIQETLKEAGTVVAPDVAKNIAISIRNPMWDWHIYLGMTLAALLLFRIGVGLFAVKKCPAAHALKSALGVKNVADAEKMKAWHYTLVKTGYALFYLVTAFMVISGLMMNFKENLGLDKSFLEPVKEIHEVMMWFFVVFVVGHLLGVIVAEFRGDAGIVSDMIHGGKKD